MVHCLEGMHSPTVNFCYELLPTNMITEFWKITHMGAPETIRILVLHGTVNSRSNFKNISKLNL